MVSIVKTCLKISSDWRICTVAKIDGRRIGGGNTGSEDGNRPYENRARQPPRPRNVGDKARAF